MPDVGLSLMDGNEVARALRVRALTGYGQDSDRARSLAAGVDVHLVKPVGLDKLMRALFDENP